MDISSAIFDPELGCAAFTVERITCIRSRSGTSSRTITEQWRNKQACSPCVSRKGSGGGGIGNRLERIAVSDTPEASSGYCFQLFRGQFMTVFFRNRKKVFRRLCCFDLFLLLVGQGAENVFGNVHVEILLIFS